MVAIDLPGYGESDKPADMSTYEAIALIDTIADIIKELGCYYFTAL